MSYFYEWQLRFILFLQSFSNSVLDGFFLFLNYFDTFFFYMIVLSSVWVGYKRKWGIRLYFLLIFSTLLVSYLKGIFSLPRPFFFIPSICKIVVPGYGFPSGAAFSSVMLSTILIYTWKNTASWIIGFNYIFWVSLSRIYLGVHFLTDVIGGWILGFFSAVIFLKLYPLVEKFVKLLPLHIAFLLSQLLAIIVFFLSGIYFGAATMGVGAGLFLQAKYKNYLEDGKTFFEIFLRSFIAFVGCLGIYFFIYWFFSFFNLVAHQKMILFFTQYYLMGFWVSFVVNYFFKSSKLKFN